MAFRSGASAGLPGGMGYNPSPGPRQSIGGGGGIPGFPALPGTRGPLGGQAPSSAFLAQGGRMGSFGMSGANGLGGHAPGSHAPNSQPEPSLDPSDFPALGAAGSQAPGLSSSSQPSYASHVNAPSANGGVPPGSDRTVAALLGGQRNDFTADDFPALDARSAHLAGDGAAREQSSAVEALQALNAKLARDRGSLSDLDKRKHANKLGVQGGYPSQSLVTNGVSPGSNQPPGIMLQAQAQGQQPGRSPVPPAGNPQQAGPTTAYGLSARTPSSQSQSLQGSGDMDTTSTQPTPSLDHTGSVASVTQSQGGSSQATSGGGQRANTVPQTPADQVLFSPADRFGLLGLLHIIKNAESDMSKLMLGMDLTSLGLDLASANEKNLYPHFMTPWSETNQIAAMNLEPEFHLPSCYHVSPPPVQHKVGAMHDETIFWIFYNQPRDVMQEIAAHELYRRNWRYHKELQVWLTKEQGVEPIEKTNHYERGDYVFFDPKEWCKAKREHTLVYDQLENKPAFANVAVAQQALALLPQSPPALSTSAAPTQAVQPGRPLLPGMLSAQRMPSGAVAT